MAIPYDPCDADFGVDALSVDINSNYSEDELDFVVVSAPEYDVQVSEPLDLIMERYIEEMQADTHRKLSMEDPQLSGADQSTDSAYSSSSSLARYQTTTNEDEKRKDDQQPINKITLAHPLHIDHTCSLCDAPLGHSIGQKILETRSTLLNPAPKEAAVMLRVHAAWAPFTEEELERAYRNLLCPHQIIALLRAPPDIGYEGEPYRQESRLAGNIIRQIAADLTASAKRDVVIVPKKLFEAAGSYDVDLPDPELPIVADQVYALRGLSPGRLLLVVKRKMEPVHWASIKSVLVYLASIGWEVYLAQEPPTLSTPTYRYQETDERLTALQGDVESMADIKFRVHIATHESNLFKGYWPLAQAATNDPHVIFEWFKATRKDVLVAEGKIDEGPKDDEEINDDGEN
ncbi:hypothetical protein PRIPAC_91400 [Pristionchus pacificus]|nr:hypothetical protein PRIPAC_91400 [Pristionchus pacificus]